MRLFRVRPKTLFWITELSKQASDGGEAQEGQAPFDDPASGQDGPCFRACRAFDDHYGQIASQGSDALTKNRALIGSIRKERLELGEGLLECGQEIQPTVPILDIPRMHQG